LKAYLEEADDDAAFIAKALMDIAHTGKNEGISSLDSPHRFQEVAN